MDLDSLFWIWFVFVGFVSVIFLYIETSTYAFLVPLILIAIGLDRLAYEKDKDKGSVKTAKSLLKKLKNK